MATVELSNVEKNLNETTPANTDIDFVDASNALLYQMQIIAFNNKMFLKLA